MPTPAVRFLEKAGIAFELLRYEHLEKGAGFASRALGFPVERTIKTLVVVLDRRRHALALAPGGRQLDMRRLARAFEAGRAEMAVAAEAERLTGCRVGGISPFATRRALPTLMEETLLGHGEVLINAGRRGLMLKMAPADIRRALGCGVFPGADPDAALYGPAEIPYKGR
jgi:Cys-tRNA(Pro)/Cys-tRNA(Cys) deacylase